jgi:hypothetical protein
MRAVDPARVYSAFEQAHFDAKADLAAAVEASTTSRPVVAGLNEIGVTELGRLCGPTTGRRVQYEQMLRLPEDAQSVALARWASRQGKAVVDLPKPSSKGGDMRALATAQRESAEAVATTLEAISDDRIDANEGVRGERECDEAIAALLVIRERFRLAQREGVIGVLKGES